MKEQKVTERQLPDAEDMARQLARVPEDKRALVTAMSQAVLIGATIADQCRESEKTARRGNHHRERRGEKCE